MTKFSLFFLGKNEVLVCEGKEKYLQPLEIVNEYIKYINDKYAALSTTFIYDFHNCFYCNPKRLSPFSIAVKSIGLCDEKEFTDKDYIFPEKPIEYSSTKGNDAQNFHHEAYILNHSGQMFLRYGGAKRKKPFERFAAMDLVLGKEAIYNYDDKIELFKKMSNSSDKTAALIGAVYYSFYIRVGETENYLSSYKGNPAKVYYSDSLLSLAWAEVAYHIEHNIEFKPCIVCGKWSPIFPGVAKRNIKNDIASTKCGYKNVHGKHCNSVECKKEYRNFYDRVNKQRSRYKPGSDEAKRIEEFIDKYFNKKKQVLYGNITSAKEEYKSLLAKNKRAE